MALSVVEQFYKDEAEDKAREKKWWAEVNASLAKTKKREADEKARNDTIAREAYAARCKTLNEKLSALTDKRKDVGLTKEEEVEFASVFEQVNGFKALCERLSALNTKHKSIGLTREEEPEFDALCYAVYGWADNETMEVIVERINDCTRMNQLSERIDSLDLKREIVGLTPNNEIILELANEAWRGLFNSRHD